MSDRVALPSATATEVALRFAAELGAGRRPSIEAALDQVRASEWPVLLPSLLIAETNARRARGERPVAREYLPRFPAHTHIVRSVVPDSEPPVPRAIRLPESSAELATAVVRRVPPRWRLRYLLAVTLLTAGAVAVFFAARLRPTTPTPPPEPPAPPPVTKVIPKSPPKAAPLDPERDLAEWVLSLGGHGTVLPAGGSRRPFGPEAPLPKGRFSVTTFSLPPETAGRWQPEALERLRGRDKLSVVQLHLKGPLTEADLAPLRGSPLRSLELDANAVQASGAFFASFPDLETLTLRQCPDFTDADLATVGKLSKLTALTLNSGKLTAKGFQELRGPIRSLSLGADVVVTADGARMLQRLPLETFESAAGMTDDAFLEFALFPDLKIIRLRKTTLTDAGLKAVIGLGKLEEFRCEGSAISGPGLESLAERKGLKVLDLSGARLTSGSLGPLLVLSGGLRELRLAGNPITDDGTAFIAQLDGLERLDLDGTEITDTSLRILTRHATLKTLIATNTRVTGPGVRAFEAGTPGCKVEYGRRLASK